MEIPSTLKILGIPYSIDRVSADDLPENAAGETNPVTQVIKIRKDIAPEASIQTLFHEIIHAINFELTEETTEWFAQTLYCVLKENDMLK
jgi:hypothetical protein